MGVRFLHFPIVATRDPLIDTDENRVPKIDKPARLPELHCRSLVGVEFRESMFAGKAGSPFSASAKSGGGAGTHGLFDFSARGVRGGSQIEIGLQVHP